MASCAGGIRAANGLRIGEQALRLFEDMGIEHALSHAVACEEAVRLGRAGRARTAGTRFAKPSSELPGTPLSQDPWSGEATYSFSPLPFTSRLDTAGHARAFLGAAVRRAP